MTRQSLHILFICNLLVFSTANGLLPLLPVYASDLGATPTLVGSLLAFAYLTLATGTMMTGRLVRWSGSTKRLFLLMALLCAVLNILLGQVVALWQLAATMAMLWFCGGVVVALIAVLTGINADSANRGKIFGLMYLAMPLGALIGGVTIGRLVDWQGYAFMFGCLGAVWLGMTIIGLFGIKDPENITTAQPAIMSQGTPAVPNTVFYVLLVAVLLSSITVFIGRLGTSLSMQALHFTPGAIATAAAAGALVVIPILPLLGSLSDRLGRWSFLSLCYALGAAGVVMLSLSTQNWHFWAASACLSMSTYAGNAIASALATDLLPPETLNWGLPRLSAMTWIGGILGFASAGYLMDALGSQGGYASAAVLSVGAVALLQLRYRQRASRRA
jgi:MFS transporter, DHA1 family, multidrug resistance protein